MGKVAMPSNGILMTPSEVSEYLGIYEADARNLMEQQKIVSIEIGTHKSLRTIKDYVDIYIKTRFKEVSNFKVK